KRAELAERLSRLLCAEVFATSRALYHHPSRKPLADVVYCIRSKTTLDRAGRGLLVNGESRLRSPAQMAALFRDKLAWVERSAEIAARLDFCFSELRYKFPCDELCAPGESADDALRRLTYAGLAVRYPRHDFPRGTPRSVVAQCEKELSLIAKIGVSAYFLSVSEVVEMARKRRILCQGRGSAANSAVCYALGVTAVDPARSNLLFERFLSAERAEPPDIDVDFEHERREEVIQDIYQKYGRGRAAMVSEVVSYRGRSALREVGKAFGLSLDQVDRLSGVIFRYDLADVNEKTVADAGIDPSDERVLKAIAVARQMEGAPRHLSIHVGGFVLSSEPLDNVAPIEPARMENRTVIPWDKDDIDTLGFFKVDVLGLGMLTCVRKSLELLHTLGLSVSQATSTTPPTSFDPIDEMARIPAEDPAVYDAICHADTVGVFQIESRAQMAMLPRLRPRCFYDLVIEVAIVRPGPIQGGMVHPYLRRRTGKEAPIAPHAVLEPILERTLGVPLFQEQVMQIAMVGAGYTPGEADQLRRDMAAWKKHGRLERHRDRLLDGFEKSGISREFGEALYKQVQGFGEYGFPESHAASFALIVYASSWLKTHHPGVFACALLNSQPMGFYSPSSIVQDAQRHGVTVLGPDIFESNWDNLMQPCPGSIDALALRLGFRQISGIGEDVGRAIERARAEARF
ncbi:MAG: error-prone DNA polymerase, partial [Myxococcales bacterium]|nr:error-prone DNA polymerase [Myxococcales bacterium]